MKQSWRALVVARTPAGTPIVTSTCATTDAPTHYITRNRDIIDAQPFVEARKRYNLAPCTDYFFCFDPYLKRILRPVAFGTEMGRFNGVPAFSSHYESADYDAFAHESAYLSHLNGVYSGHKWQCVEYSRRYLIAVDDVTFPDVNMAYEIFDLPQFERITRRARHAGARCANGMRHCDKVAVDVVKCRNGQHPADDASMAAGLERPAPGCLLIWNYGGFFSFTGHVAVVTEVLEVADHLAGAAPCAAPDAARGGATSATSSAGGSSVGRRFIVRVAEQNVYDEHWGGRNYSRELPATINANGAFHIHDPSPQGGTVKGWIRALRPSDCAATSCGGGGGSSPSSTCFAS